MRVFLQAVSVVRLDFVFFFPVCFSSKEMSCCKLTFLLSKIVQNHWDLPTIKRCADDIQLKVWYKEEGEKGFVK